MNKEQALRYLEVLGCDWPEKLDAETLADLCLRHQCNIPFQSVSVYATKKQPSLDPDDVFNKVIVERKGGFCFELNLLFEHFLRALGYDARPCLCVAVLGRPGRMPINHRGVIVSIDGLDHFVDVGFGGPMAVGGVALIDGIDQTFHGERFRVFDRDNGWWRIDRLTRSNRDFYDDESPEHWRTEIEVCKAFVEDVDFGPLNIAFTSPGAVFYERPIVNLRTPSGHRALSGDKLTIRENGAKEVMTLHDNAETAEALKKYFNLDMDDLLQAGN